MKKRNTLITFFIAAFFCGSIFAKQSPPVLCADAIKLTRTGDKVTIEFDLITSRKAVKSDYSLVVTPVLENGVQKEILPAVAVQGKRAYISGPIRNSQGGNEIVYYIEAEVPVHYQTTIVYQEWIKGSKLSFEGMNVGCCTATRANIGLIAENLLVRDEPVVIPAPAPEPVILPTTGEKLAEKYSFIAPYSDFENILGENSLVDLAKFIDSNRDGSVSIYFKVGTYDIERDYSSNNSSLVQLTASVRTIAASTDSRIARIMIAGFASPEGSARINEFLALNRAAALKDFLLENTAIQPDLVSVYNGLVDWTALRNMVEKSNMPYKDGILKIIDTPFPGGHADVKRLEEMRKLDSGRPYKYIYDNFYSRLRNAAYIKVYFENTGK